MLILHFKAAPLILLVILGAFAYARGACQAYRSDPAFLHDVEKGDFLARFSPHKSPLSSEQKRQIQAIMRGNSLKQIGERAQMEGLWRQFTGASLPLPITMSAPVQLKILPASYPVTDPVRVEFDADGDGKPELVQELGAPGASLSYIYQQEGHYEYVVRIHDRSGKLHDYKARLRVLSERAFDAELQKIWSEFREALRGGEMALALDCIHTQSRARYRDMFAAIPDLNKKVDEIFSALRFVERREGEAIYEMARAEGKNTLSFELRFGVDVDGVWRIRSF